MEPRRQGTAAPVVVGSVGGVGGTFFDPELLDDASQSVGGPHLRPPGSVFV
jgi:hypothetical protein